MKNHENHDCQENDKNHKNDEIRWETIHKHHIMLINM